MTAGVRAFIIDDDPGVRSFLCLLMKRRGYEVVEYDRAAPCVTCRHKPGTTCADLILCDLRMPGTSGVEFADNQKRVGCTCGCIALMSGQWTEEELIRARQLGCRTLHKPFPFSELEQWLDQCESAIDPHRILVDDVPDRT